MKYFLCALAALTLTACDNGNPPATKKFVDFRGHTNPLEVIEVDGCEYLFGDWANATVLTHKGNCKFCAERAGQVSQVERK